MAHPLSGEKLLACHRDMMRIRRFEEQAGLMYQMRKFGGFCHLYIGQEAVAVGVMAALEERDQVVTAYREHGQAMARGVPQDAIMAELYGRATGCSGGMGGSMHLFDASVNFMGGWGIVGAQIPLAGGMAFANRYLKNGAVTVCFFGEGSIHQGAFHETMNMAALWKLPLICICENNHYAMGTPLHRQTNVTEVHHKAKGYDIEHALVDGQTVRTVYDAVKEAVDRARNGAGPTLLEMKTYRFRGHSMSDPATYRTRDEVEAEMKRDPLLLAQQLLLDEEVTTQEALDTMDKEIKAAVRASIKHAESSPFPDLAEIWTHVLVD